MPKKREFQEIHDRFIRDQELRNRMIENHRDEDLCRRWDALADEDHTHHLTAQEYLHYNNKWWHHSNKQGSNTMPLRHRPDFKQALSTLQRLQQEAGEEPPVPLIPTSTNNGSWHRVHLLQGGIGKVHGGLLIIPKVKTEMHQVLSERSDLLRAVFGKILRKNTFMNSIYFVTDGSFAADGGLL